MKSTAPILIADDDADDQVLTLRALRQCGYESPVYAVSDGEELMAYLRHTGTYTHPEGAPRPGLILLDLNMPRKDGREALQDIKQDPALRAIPVVVLSTSDALHDVELTYALGVNAFMTKPASYEGLQEAMQAVLNFWFVTAQLPTP